MGSHLGWHFPVGCPLRGGRGEFILKKHQKQLRKKKINLDGKKNSTQSLALSGDFSYVWVFLGNLNFLPLNCISEQGLGEDLPERIALERQGQSKRCWKNKN
jgi:hypothetical protein